MPKKLKKWTIVLIALATITAIGVTFAFMFKKASITNTFVRAEVSCVVYEKMDYTEVAESFFEGNEKSDIRVQNTGNVNEYLRVRLVSYFVNENKNITGDIPCVYPEIILNEKWLQGKDNIYYYTEAVEPNAFTSELCQTFALEKKLHGTVRRCIRWGKYLPKQFRQNLLVQLKAHGTSLLITAQLRQSSKKAAAFINSA